MTTNLQKRRKTRKSGYYVKIELWLPKWVYENRADVFKTAKATDDGYLVKRGIESVEDYISWEIVEDTKGWNRWAKKIKAETK